MTDPAYFQRSNRSVGEWRDLQSQQDALKARVAEMMKFITASKTSFEAYIREAQAGDAT